MFEFRRMERFPSLDVRMSHHALIGPKMRYYAVDSSGIAYAPLLHGAGDVSPGRAQLQVVLRGSLLLNRGNTTIHLQPGDVYFETPMSLDERRGAEWFQALCLDWRIDPTSAARAGGFRLAPAALEELRAHVRRDELPSLDVFRDVLANGCADWETTSGWGQVASDLSVGDAPPELQKVLDVLGRLLSSLHEKPMWCDFVDQLGCSERHLRRQMQTVLDWFPGPSDESCFRTYLKLRRLSLGCGLMGAPGANVSHVSELLGYNSPIAFANTCRRAGVGAPSSYLAA